MTRRAWLMILAATAAWPIGAPRRAGGESLKLAAPAPEIVGGPWIGSAPLTTASLRGRVALIEFWTYG